MAQKKTSILIVLALVLSLALFTACGSGETPQDDPNNTTGAAIETDDQTGEDEVTTSEAIDVPNQEDDPAVPATQPEETGQNTDTPAPQTPPATSQEGVYPNCWHASYGDDLKGVTWDMSGALFIGDSRTEGLRMYGGITGADFFCAKSMTIDKILKGGTASVGGTTKDISTTLSTGSYSRVYICLGLNELGWNHIDKFLTSYTTLIDMVRDTQPGATIYIESLFPVSMEKHNQGTIVNNEQIYWYNSNLINLASQTGCRFINCDGPLVDADGALCPTGTNDGVHLTSAFCRLWAQKLSELS